MSDLPEDIKPQWLSLIRRMQSVGKSGGFSVIHISVLVDENGTPVCWIEPKQVKIEPRPKSGANAILTLAELSK